MSKWKTKKDLPILWGICLLTVFLFIQLKGKAIIVYLYGEEIEGTIEEFTQDHFFYRYTYKNKAHKLKVKQHKRYMIEEQKIIPLKVLEGYKPIHIDNGGLTKLYTLFIFPIIFLSIPIIVTFLTLVLAIKGVKL